MRESLILGNLTKEKWKNPTNKLEANKKYLTATL